MALTYVYMTLPNGIAFAGPGVGGSAGSGKSYSANAAGVITGVTPADAQTIQGVNGAPLLLMCANGNTADRPPAAVATGGAINNVNPQPFLGMPFHDLTLGYSVFYSGTERSSTGYVDHSGNAA